MADPQKLKRPQPVGLELCASIAITASLMLLLLSGCDRRIYRQLADRDAYNLLSSRQSDPLWKIPARTVEPDPRSRMADINDPDCGPLPPDDEAASCYMRKPFNSKRQITFWDDKGQLVDIDSQQWLDYLPKDENGEVLVDRQLTVDLALLHNRDYQDQVEGLYTQALGLSSNRFEFLVNWLGGTDTGFTASGDGLGAQRDLSQSTNLGLNRAFATGGQFAANLANTFSWQLGGNGGPSFSGGNLVFNLTQPLLRNAFRHVRTEGLTSSERNLLYSVRNFASFRRQFYLTFVSQYYGLLQQIRSLEIEKENLASLERNLEGLELQFELQKVSRISVDQVFQDYQQGRLQLINSEQDLQTSLDQFKFSLGLPARVNIKLDESFLEAFRLNSEEIETLDQEVRDLTQSMNRDDYLPPEEAPTEFLDEVERKIEAFSKQVEKLKPSVDADLEKWFAQLDAFQDNESTTEADRFDQNQQRSLAEQLETTLQQLQDKIDGTDESNRRKKREAEKEDQEKDGDNDDEFDLDEEDLEVEVFDKDDPPNVKRWKLLRAEISKDGGLADKVSTLFVSEAQCRLFLIKINPLEIDEQQAIEIALRKRLDLKNAKAQVVDAYRQVEIAADGLQSDLNISASAALSTDPNRNNPLRFDSEENAYNVGINFDGPLNRFNERNGYRSAQIGYQQQRRAYMVAEDSIVNGIRQNLRQLRNSQLNFQIARQSLITATRQVEQTQIALRAGGSTDSSSTQDLLNALSLLRDNKNNLISSWITYEIARIGVFVDLESLELDENGIWTNDSETIGPADGSGRSDSASADRPQLESELGEDSNSNRLESDSNRTDLEPIDSEPELVEPLQPEANVPLDKELLDLSDTSDGRNTVGLVRLPSARR